MGKKKKKNLIDEDCIKAFRKANREIEMERNGGRWIAIDRPHRNKKKYYRIHIAYLIIICSLKQNLSLAMLQKIIPMGINEDEVKEIYESFAKRHNLAAQYFVEQVRLAAASILDHDEKSELDAKDPNDMITFAAVISCFSRLLAEKLLLLDGKTIENGGSIEIVE